jgi:formate hydrogenlyase transcriptional activator
MFNMSAGVKKMATSFHGRERRVSRGRISTTERYQAAAGILSVAGSHRDPETLFRALAHEMRSVVKVHTIGIVHYDESAEIVEWCAFDSEGSSPSLSPLIRWESSVCRRVYDSQQPLFIDLTRAEDPFSASLDFLTEFGVTCACTLPLTTAQRRLGAMIFASQERDYYSPDTVDLLSGMADQVALAMDGAFNSAALEIARARLQNETAKLKLLLDLNNAIVSDLELGTLVRQIAPCIRGLMQVDAVALILPDSNSSELHLHALDFPNQLESQPQAPQSLRRDSIAGEVFHSGQPWIGSLKPVAQSLARDLAEITGLKTLCVLPLMRRNRVLGVLGLGRLKETLFAEDDVDFLLQVAGQVAIAVENALEYRHVTTFSDQLVREKLYLEDEIRDRMHFKEIIGESTTLGRILKHVETVAPTECTVLICGETGTGKELVARAIHNHSSHKQSAFVKVNCAALPAGLLESELFGHEKGAFTGAVTQRIGRFELASHGTIFLDEISELPLELQPKLLRVLQEREFERLGSSRTLRTNARLIAATNRDLKAMVAEQKFRADLFYRLNVFPVELPPLRERTDDIPLLVSHFTQLFAQNLNKHIDSIPSETMNAFLRYGWPGNIRELQNVIERAVILSPGPTLNVPLSELSPNKTDQISNGAASTLKDVERRHILSVLNETNWVFAGPHGAAARLGIKRSTLQFRMKKLGIKRPPTEAAD